MQELITVSKSKINEQEINSVNAREIWQFVESKKQFADWIKIRIEKYGFVEGVDYLTIHKKVNRQTLVEYIVSLDMAKELAMVENNEKGRQARRYFIEIEKRYRADQEEKLNQIKQWQDARFDSKIIRKSFMEIVSLFIQMANDQGAANAEAYYMNFTKIIQKSLFYVTSLKKVKKNLRDNLDTDQLIKLSCAEVMAKEELIQLIRDNEPYKLVYQIIKQKTEQLTRLLGKSFPTGITEDELLKIIDKKTYNLYLQEIQQPKLLQAL